MPRHVQVALPLAIAALAVLGLATAERLRGAPGGSPGRLAPAAPEPRTPAAEQGTRGCRPNCRGRTCGSDGCGGDCGTCSGAQVCFGNRCVKRGGVGPCRLVSGRWTGSFLINPVHHLDGQVFVRNKACRARFRVTFPVGSSQGWAVEDFEVTLSKNLIRFRGLRIVSRSSNSRYSLDHFDGTLNTARTRFLGQLRDNSGVSGRVVLNKR